MTDKENNTRTDLNRRQFVEKSSLLAGGVVAASLTGGATAYAAGSDTLKVAVVGCGGRGTGAAAQALVADEGVEIVALADAFGDRAAKCLKGLSALFGERVKVTPESTFIGFDAFRKAIDLADVVILATPPGFRPEHFEYAVAHNKHIFMEKPVATDAHGVRRVLAAAKDAKARKLNVVVGLQRRYQSCYLETLQRYRDGAVGEIVAGQVYWNSSGVWVRPRLARQTEMEYQMRNWYYFNWLCGDHILEQHIHNIDVANWFIGDYPVSAQGMGGRQVRKGPDHGEIFDHHFVEYTYASGAVISSQCRHQPGCVNTVAERFQATGGEINTSGMNTGVLTDRGGKSLYKHEAVKERSPYQTEQDKLFASIRAGEQINDAEIGAQSTLSAIMGRMATYSGKLILAEQALASERRLVPDSADLGWDVAPPTTPDAEGNYPIPTPGVTEVL